MPVKKRRWDDSADEDPGAGLLNLFDVWIAFAVALLLAMVSFFCATPPPPSGTTGTTGTPPTPVKMSLEAIEQARTKLDRFRESRETAGGEGERLGTAYRLQSGEVIYVPDPNTASHPAPPPLRLPNLKPET